MFLIFSIGCAPGTLDAEEADRVFAALTSVNGDTWAHIYERSAPIDADEGTDTGFALAKALQFHTDFTDGTFDGTVEGPGSWTGTVSVDGSFTTLSNTGDSWEEIWDIAIGWEDVRWSDLRLDGEFHWALHAEVDGTSEFTYSTRVDGEITCRGGATGVGNVDYFSTTILGGGRYEVFVSGTVAGTDISSEWDATDALGM